MPPTLAVPLDAADKEAWRSAAHRARGAIETERWSEALVAALRAWPPYRRAGTVALYLPFGSEADLRPLLQDGKRFAAPRTPGRGRRLRMHLLGGPLERHRFGMDEPAADAQVVPEEAFDVALVPGLAFDGQGVRLGYGGGYYDVWLAQLSPATARVGIAHPALLAEALPREAHDVVMTHLALPDGVRSISSASDRGPDRSATTGRTA